MRPNVQFPSRYAPSTALPAPRRPVATRGQSGAVAGLARLNLAGVAFLIYLWVVHSGKLAIGAAAIVVGLVGLLVQKERLRVPAPLLLFGAFLAYGWMGLVTAQFPAASWEALVDYTKIGLIFLLALNLAHNKTQFRWMMVAWLGIFALYPVRGTLFNMMFGIKTQGRFAWNFMFSNPNDLATLCLPILAMSAAMLQTTQEKWVKKCALAGVVILPIIIFATQSRGGILALFTFGACILLQYRKRMGAVLLILLIGAAVVQLAPPEVWQRLANIRKAADESTISEADKYGSAQQRSDIWKVAVAVIADHPVTGTGAGGYGPTHRAYAATGRFEGLVGGSRDPHSTYLGTAAEFGLPGLLIFLAMVGSVFIAGFRRISALKWADPPAAAGLRSLLFGLMAFLQACIFATMTHLPSLYIYLAVICTYIAVHQPGVPALRPAAAARRRR